MCRLQPPPSGAHHGNITAVVELLERAREQTWYHTLELPGKEVTPGSSTRVPTCRPMGSPSGWTGCAPSRLGMWDGFWAFELERRGAEVVALHLDDERDLDWPPRRRPTAFPDEAAGQGLRAGPRAAGFVGRPPQSLHLPRHAGGARRAVRPRLLRLGAHPPARPAAGAAAHGRVDQARRPPSPRRSTTAWPRSFPSRSRATAPTASRRSCSGCPGSRPGAACCGPPGTTTCAGTGASACARPRAGRCAMWCTTPARGR